MIWEHPVETFALRCWERFFTSGRAAACNKQLPWHSPRQHQQHSQPCPHSLPCTALPSPIPQEGTPPWEWDPSGKISNIPLGMCRQRIRAHLKWRLGSFTFFPLWDVGGWKGLGLLKENSALKAIPKVTQAVSNHWEIGQILVIFRSSWNVDGQQQWMTAVRGRENNYLHCSRHIFVHFCVSLFVFQKKILLQQNQQGQLENVDFTD